MHRFSVRVALSLAFVLALTLSASATLGPMRSTPRGPVRPAYARPCLENRVHNAGKLWMNIVNRGYFGNDGPAQNEALDDPCPPNRWAPQAEFPGGTGQQYLFQAGLWIGALIVEDGFETRRVSVATDGWVAPSINEFWPGECPSGGIVERSTRPGMTNCLGDYVSSPDAVSDQDFLCVYTDTLTDDQYVESDEIDGPHRPLGIRVKQTSYSFSQAFAEDFILIDYEIENIAQNYLKNLYIGLYVDADCGPKDRFEQHTDDICGFLRNYTETNSLGEEVTTPIDVAWIADNDGWDPEAPGGPFVVPHVAGTRVIRAPNPRLQTSFNWWVSFNDVGLDFGPSWQAYCERDSLGMGWTREYGTPMGDERKYQVLSNREFDYWQIYVNRPDSITDQVTIPDGVVEPWCTSDPSTEQDDIANGYDTRYLLSWGPLGIFDFTDAAGRDIYRLNPGEKFNMTIAYVAGENFHDPGNAQTIESPMIDPEKFNFADLRENARWAKDVYDNRMFDTPQYDWGNDRNPHIIDADSSQGDGVFDLGDGWYGEDVGTDGLYAELLPGQTSDSVFYFVGARGPDDPGIFAGIYTGPDADGTERNGRIDPVHNSLMNWAASEDFIIVDTLRYLDHPRWGDWDVGWMSGNGVIDLGDGLPDFTGPPPPPIPALMYPVPNTYNAAAHAGGIVRPGEHRGGLGYELRADEIILRWSKNSSENVGYRDPFTRVQDFEGYRIHSANVNQDNSYSLLAEFDKIDFAYFAEGTDSLMTIPVESTEGLPPCSTISGVTGCLRPVGLNKGFTGRDAQGNPNGEVALLMPDDSTYEFHIKAHKLAPSYYAVTAFDYGDPRSGLGSLATRPTANAVLLAPAGSDKEPVRVVPNPYRAYEDYTVRYGDPQSGVSWENQNDGTADFYSQADRRIEFINLPDQCLIRIYTVAGDLVQILPHNIIGDRSQWPSPTSERWDLNSRNKQQVVSGIYLFSVENMTPGKGHEIETGKFVIIR